MRRRVTDQPASDRGCCRAVERDGAKIGEVLEQMLDTVVLGKADGLVEAARTRRGRDHIPQADGSLAEPVETFLVAQAVEVLADR